MVSTTSSPRTVSTRDLIDDSGLLMRHGREFHEERDGYLFPSAAVDKDEQERLHMQHNALKIHMGALYPERERVQAALRVEQTPPPVVLDVGTGSGIWYVIPSFERLHHLSYPVSGLSRWPGSSRMPKS